MIIGLVRHYKVDFRKENKYLSAEDFSLAMERYETSPIIIDSTKKNLTGWDICYCSIIRRAVETAQHLYSGSIIYSDLIIEVPVAPFTKSKIKLPSFIWHLGGRIAWHKNHPSQPEVRKQTLKRIEQFVDEIEKSGYEKILVVSHGFFMRVLVEFLLQNGFKGKIDLRPENGKLYLFEKN